jgi:hypothetical protein
MRPQIAGSRFLSLSVSYAPVKSPSATRLMKVGMSISTGQPSTHGLFLHSMHRSASCRAISTEYPHATSSNECRRTAGSTAGIGVFVLRPIFLAIGYTCPAR